MQLKGLVRFFTILLIAYSIYQLSFTWFVKNHEKKMDAIARSYVKYNFQSAAEKYPGNKDSQAVYQEFLDQAYQDKLKRLLDSTKEKTITYAFTGPVSYQKAKEEELNLGLDLQGGMNVTLEVEMTGLLKSLANGSKDPNFLLALQNAEKRKANSSADFITLFVEEFRKLEKDRLLAPLFAGNSADKIRVTDPDNTVESYLHSQAAVAFDGTYKRLRTRIDQFGVAQPNINPNSAKGTINVELPGLKDKERVRKILQSTANLQFWELYCYQDPAYVNGWKNVNTAFDLKMSGKAPAIDSALLKDSSRIKDSLRIQDSINKKNGKPTTQPVIKKPIDSNHPRSLSEQLIDSTNKLDTTKKQQIKPVSTGITLGQYINFSQNGRDPSIGTVAIKDTGKVNKILDEYGSYFPNDIIWSYGIPPKGKKGTLETRVDLYALRTFGRTNPKLDGEAISNATVDYDQFGKIEVGMQMKPYGAKIWETMTTQAAGKENDPNDNRSIAIVLDNIVYSAPNVLNPIAGGRSSISGNYTTEDATDLANLLKIGKLPAPAKIVEEQQVGATLGKEAIKKGSMAFLVSFIVIFLLMLVYYNTSGWIANIALILNLLFTIGVLAGLGASLTAPGIAGLVLTIGMAVDTNVIIYERIKEELSKGKGYIPAINEGYKRSLPPVLDAHVTVLLTAIILFYFGLGPVKGFATTQILGILLSLFCGILVSRWITEWFTSKKRHLEYFTKVSKRVFQHAKFKFIEYRKIAYVISFAVLALGISSYFHGFDEGVEFKGGRSYKIAFGRKVDVEQVRKELQLNFVGESPVIKTIGDNATLDITTAYLINSTGPETDSIVEAKLMVGLKNHLPPNITFKQFDQKFKQESKTVLPTISDDLKRGAVKATIFALLIIFLYIFMRFRDWRYSLGTIIALLHDVFVILIVFSFARSIVPFPLEIDQHFIAAVLTVIGFSMNDTVIVFDRIREKSRMMPNAPRSEVINLAINETLSRTIMTSLTVFLTILILFLVGGEVTKGFAFAMLVGIVTGTYSSIFVAAPILVDLGGKKPLGRKSTSLELKEMAKQATTKPEA